MPSEEEPVIEVEVDEPWEVGARIAAYEVKVGGEAVQAVLTSELLYIAPRDDERKVLRVVPLHSVTQAHYSKPPIRAGFLVRSLILSAVAYGFLSSAPGAGRWGGVDVEDTLLLAGSISCVVSVLFVFAAFSGVQALVVSTASSDLRIVTSKSTSLELLADVTEALSDHSSRSRRESAWGELDTTIPIQK